MHFCLHEKLSKKGVTKLQMASYLGRRLIWVDYSKSFCCQFERMNEICRVPAMATVNKAHHVTKKVGSKYVT